MTTAAAAAVAVPPNRRWVGPIRHNTVMSYLTDAPCPVDRSARKLNGTWDEEKFRAAAVCRCKIVIPGPVPKDMCVTLLMYSTGLGVVTGAKSVESAELAIMLHRYRMSMALKRYVRSSHHTVCNMQATGYGPYKFNLHAIKAAYPGCTYYPDNFPGLTYPLNMSGCNIVVRVFRSGNLVITGGRTDEDMMNAFYHIMPILEEYANGPREEMTDEEHKAMKQLLKEKDAEALAEYDNAMKRAAEGVSASGLVPDEASTTEESVEAPKKKRKQKTTRTKKRVRIVEPGE